MEMAFQSSNRLGCVFKLKSHRALRGWPRVFSCASSLSQIPLVTNIWDSIKKCLAAHPHNSVHAELVQCKLYETCIYIILYMSVVLLFGLCDFWMGTWHSLWSLSSCPLDVGPNLYPTALIIAVWACFREGMWDATAVGCCSWRKSVIKVW